MDIKIRKGTIQEAVALSKEVTEFFQPYSEKSYEERLEGVAHLILIATVDDKPVGFKVGYCRYGRETFYSWMGGVLDQYRRKGIATKLADEQETWAKTQGFIKVVFKNKEQVNKNDPFWAQQRIFDSGFDQKRRCQRLPNRDGENL
jgi:predicted GNAT superfamily acetyltransferase